MSVTATLVVERVGNAVVQDLGRPGFAHLGVSTGGASDQRSARAANLLVGNAEGAPLVEITGSELALRATSPLLLAVTGAAPHVLVDDMPQPAGEPLAVGAGGRLVVPAGATFRSYLAINGAIEARRILGSVAPDTALGLDQRLVRGDAISGRTAISRLPDDPFGELFRLGMLGPTTADPTAIDVLPGPELEQMVLGERCLDSEFVVARQSDHVGLRFDGPPIARAERREILSRGVPIGAVEVASDGGLIVLLRGRMLTAGYPVIGVVTTEALDRMGQLGPGHAARFAFCAPEVAGSRLRERERFLATLGARARAALAASGLGHAVSEAKPPRSTP